MSQTPFPDISQFPAAWASDVGARLQDRNPELVFEVREARIHRRLRVQIHPWTGLDHQPPPGDGMAPYARAMLHNSGVEPALRLQGLSCNYTECSLCGGRGERRICRLRISLLRSDVTAGEVPRVTVVNMAVSHAVDLPRRDACPIRIRERESLLASLVRTRNSLPPQSPLRDAAWRWKDGNPFPTPVTSLPSRTILGENHLTHFQGSESALASSCTGVLTKSDKAGEDMQVG